MRRAVLVSTTQVSAWLSRSERHSVWLVVAVRPPSLVIRIAATANGTVIHRQAENQRLGNSPLCTSSNNIQFFHQVRALLVLLDFCLFALFLSSSSLLSVSEVGLVPSAYPVCESKAETKTAIERFENSIFNVFPPPLGGRPCFTLGLCPLLDLLSFSPFFWASFRN